MSRIRVLLVEDNPGDVDLTRETLENSRPNLEISVAVDGVEAMNMLRGRGKHSAMMRPDVILLDLNLPKKDGRQILSEIKEDAELRHIPVVILTSSDAERDIAQSYAIGANCYVTKPVDLRAFQSVLGAVKTFWFDVVKLPVRAQGEGGPAHPDPPVAGCYRS